MNDDISIKIDAPKVRSGALIRVVASFFKVARHVSAGVMNQNIEWMGSVKEGSNIFVAQPEVPKPTAENIVGIMLGGFKSIASGFAQRPSYFDDDALEGVRSIATADVQEAPITIFSNGSAVRIERMAATTVDDILGSAHKSFGDVEGRLVVLSDHGGFKFSIIEPIHGKEVNCYIIKDELIDKAVMAFRKRVSAQGLVKYRRDGTPMSVDVDDLRVFDDDSILPRTSEIIGIYKRE